MVTTHGPMNTVSMTTGNAKSQQCTGHCQRCSAFGHPQISLFCTGQGNLSSCNVPRPIPSLDPLGIVQIACGESHSAALSIDGRLFTWGRGKYGALGLGSLDNFSWPQHVQKLPARGSQVCLAYTYLVQVPICERKSKQQQVH